MFVAIRPRPKQPVPSGPVRLIVARCRIRYTGRLNAVLPESTRLLMLKADGSVLVHADAGGYKPLNWMTPPTVIEDEGDTLVVRKRAGKSEDRLEITLLEVLSDVDHDMGEAAALEKDGVERDLQELLADGRRRWRRAAAGAARVADRYRPRRPDVPRRRRFLGCGRDQAGRDDRGRRAALPLPRADPARSCPGRTRGILAAQHFKPQALVLAEGRGIPCAEVDLALLRGEREPELTLFV